MIDRRLVIPVAIAIVAAVAGGVIAGAWAASRPERYEADVVLAVGPAADLTTDADVIDVVGGLDRGGITATAAGIAGSRSVRDAAIAAADLGIDDLSDYEVDSVPVLDSNLIDVTVSGPESATAAELANAVSRQLQIRFQAIYPVYRIEVLTAAEPPDASGRPGVALVAIAGALLALAATGAIGWAAFAGRRPRSVRRGDREGADGA